jgi:hypothetical protein
LLGKIVFLCRVIQPGRIFVQRLFTAASKVKLLYHRVKLLADAMKDISWWLKFVHAWNGTSVFLEDDWTLSSVLCFAADASNAGMGAVYLKHWWSAPFNPAHLKLPIAWRELFAIVVSCRIWGHAWASKRVLIECDNQTIVHSVNNGSSKKPNIMSLIRDLFFIGSYIAFNIRFKHLPCVHNVGPDLLSRLKITQFKQTFPGTNTNPTPIPPDYLAPAYKMYYHVAPQSHGPEGRLDHPSTQY